MFTINGSTRYCNKGLYVTEDEKEIEFLLNNKMFVALDAPKEIIEPEIEDEDTPVFKKSKKKGVFKRK